MSITSAAPLVGAELARVLFAPRSIALVGASSDPTKAASRPLAFLRRDGFAGDIHVVNRRGGRIAGEPAYTSVDELPAVPEHAFIMTSAATTLDAVEQCGRAGVRLVTVLGDGFRESGPDGERRERRLLELAEEYNLRVLGPSSLGVVCARSRFTLTANAAFAEPGRAGGGLFVASQSGSMIGGLLSRGASRGIGFSHLVSVGGEADLSIGEICAGALDDPDVTGFLLFLESLRHADRLREFAAAAAERNKPAVAFKLGRSTQGAQLTVSHTGALAGEDEVAEAFLAGCGIARLRTLDGFLEAVPLLTRVPAGPRSSRRPRRSVGVVTTTGGGAAMVVDQLGVRGVEIVPPSEATRRKLAESGVDHAPGLIVDLTLAGTRPEIMSAALDVLCAAEEFDVLVVVVGSSARSQPELAVAPILHREAAGSPLAVFLVPDAPSAMEAISSAGLAVFRTPESCADAIAAALSRRAPRPVESAAPREDGPVRGLDEADSYQLMRRIGVPVAPYTTMPLPITGAPPPGLRFPVALKALSADLPHKTDVGGVVLGVSGPDELAEAAARLRRDVELRAGIRVERVMVQEMADGLGEVLVGYRIDPEVGPVVMVAAGGVMAELHQDRVLAMAPVDRETAVDMLGELRSLATLRGFRGAPHGDLDALADLVVTVSQLARSPEVVEAELNPVMVGAAGEGVVAVDALVHVTGEAKNGEIGA